MRCKDSCQALLLLELCGIGHVVQITASVLLESCSEPSTLAENSVLSAQPIAQLA